jgi:tetratricopeptide (TPR) repeat protein
MLPPAFLETQCGEKRVPLSVACMHRFAPPDCSDTLVYGERFKLEQVDERLIIRARGQKTLGVVDVQRLFDLLEALPASLKHVAVALEPDYSAQGSDIRWVVDTYNILDKRGCQFTLIVGSMENHTTFVNLGIDSHIKLELELERSNSVSLERLSNRAEPAQPQPQAPAPLTPSAGALVAQIETLLQSGDAVEAAKSWRRLLSEGLDRTQVANLGELRTRLYDRLLSDGKEAMDAEDHDTATERFNTLIDLDPGRFEGHFHKGLLLKSEGKLEYAQAFLTQAILAAPDEAELFYHRAIVRSRVDDTEGALRDLDMALQHNPRMVAAYYNRAKVHKQMGRSDLAKRDMLMYERLKGGSTRAAKTASQQTPAAEEV